MRHIILFITIFISFSGFALAQEAQEMFKPLSPEPFNRFYQQINNKVINPTRQAIKTFPSNVETGLKHLLEEVKEKKQQTQEEIKQAIKEEAKKEAKEWVGKIAEKIENFLAPLKNKIQQGSTLVRDVIYKIKDFFIGLFKR